MNEEEEVIHDKSALSSEDVYAKDETNLDTNLINDIEEDVCYQTNSEKVTPLDYQKLEEINSKIIDTKNYIKQKENATSPGGNNSDSELHAAESLLISETDEENISPLRTKSINSDREKNSPVAHQPHESFLSKYKALVDTESSSENDKESPRKTSSDSKTEKTNSDLIKKKNKFSSLIDSDSDPEVSESNEKLPNSKFVPPKRASAKESMEQMKAIKSETQRLSRESRISIPYHKPKRHTLKEFLTRKTIVKPNVLKTTKLKMNKEELEEYAKHLEERAKEASEFFKSDSETDKEIIKDTTISDVETQNIGQSLQPNLPNDKIESQHSAEPIDETNAVPIIENEKISTNSTSNIENLKMLMAIDKELPPAPTLKGDPKMLIDFDTGNFISPKPSGVDNLLEKFLKNSAKRKTKTTENLSILSIENNKNEMTNISVTLHEEPESIDYKPGSAYFKLKNNLKKLITSKRKEELLKRIKGNKELTMENESKENDEESNDEEEDENELEEEVTEIDEKEDFLDNEAEETDVDSETDGDADDEDGDPDEYHEEDHNLQDKRKKSRIISAFEDSDDETEKVTKAIDDILSEPLPKSNDKLLWMNTDPKEPDEENELLELCSGNFDTTQKKPLISQIPTTQITQNVNENELLELCSGNFDTIQKKPLISQIPTTQITQNVNENELWELCSGNFNEEQKTEQNDNKITTQSISSKNLNLDSSDEEITMHSVQVKKSKKKKKLCFSDDEDYGDIDNPKEKYEEAEHEEENIEDISSDSVEDPVETYIDYDSEENEIEVKMTKDHRLEKAAEFFENEAELSESDWGSADEDEKDLDRYDIELGDEEQFDKQKLRSELEQIHLRKMLDDDMREVKKIQEMLFEDEENDGVGRQRRFRWKQSENGFSLDNPLGLEANGGNLGSDDEENEEMWRKMRHERALLLKDKVQMIKEKSSEFPAKITLLSDPPKKITVIKTKRTNVAAENSGSDSPFLISKATKTSIRGSFLERDKDTLKKLATFTKVGADSDGTAGTVQIKSRKVRSFVFATLSESEHMNNKRTSPDTSNNEINHQAKKQKITQHDKLKKTLIDHLF